MSAEEVVYQIVVDRKAANVWDIAGRADEKKREFFKRHGWSSGEVIKEGDVRCVLEAIIDLAGDRLDEQRKSK